MIPLSKPVNMWHDKDPSLSKPVNVWQIKISPLKASKRVKYERLPLLR
jgi:hypothetical protein